MSEKHLSPANVIPHIIRKIRLLERAIRQGNDLNESGYICGDWTVVKNLIYGEISHYKNQLNYWRTTRPEIVSYYEALPRVSDFCDFDDPYKTGKWVTKHGNYAIHYTGLVIRSRYGKSLLADPNELDDIPF